MFSEYLLGDNFERGREAGYHRSDGGCLVMFAVLGSLISGGLFGLVITITNFTF